MNKKDSLPGKFIVIEGMDGSGKSTVCEYITSELNRLGHQTIGTYEVGGTPIGKQLRQLSFSEHHGETLYPDARLLLVCAARLQHLREVILPALTSGVHVVCDRFSLSTYAYQGILDGQLALLDGVMRLPELSLLNTVPDHLIYLDIAPDVAYRRGVARANIDNTKYKSTLNQARITQAAYLEALRCFSSKTKCATTMINANNSIDDVKYHVALLAQQILKN